MARRAVTIAVTTLFVLGTQTIAAGEVAAVVPTCFGQPATMVGTDAGETINGTPGDDVIVALGGNDDVRPGRGDDLVCGGEGDDHIGDLENVDQFYTNSGDDAFAGEAGNDSLGLGLSDGADRLYGGDGNDHISFGYQVQVRAVGGPGDDLFFDEGGAGVVFAGPGNDSWRDGCCYGGGTLRFYGGDGNEDIKLDGSGSPHWRIFGNAGNDLITLGDDARPSKLDGGGGNDTLRTCIEEPTVMWGRRGRDVLASCQGRMYGGPGPDRLKGSTLNDRMFGGDGPDILRGYRGNDTLYGGDGRDELHGNRGRDDLHGGSGPDTLFGSWNNDSLLGGRGRDNNFGSHGSDLCRSPKTGSRAHSCER